MESHELKPELRAQLFDALLQQHHQQGDWDKVFQLLSQGRQVAEAAQLQGVAEKLEQGQDIVMQGLRNSGRFLEWELTILEVGLATASIAESYRRLRDHYVLQQQFSREIRNQCKAPMAMVVVLLGVMYGWLVFQQAMTWPTAAGVFAVSVAVLFLVVAGVARVVEQTMAGAASPGITRLLGHMPWLGGVIRAGQLHHFFKNLTQAVAANLPLGQSLQLAAQKTPIGRYQREFLSVYDAVQQGGKLSTALATSRILTGVALAPIRTANAGADEAMSHITESVYTDYVERLFLLARSFPQLVFLLLLLMAFGQILAL